MSKVIAKFTVGSKEEFGYPDHQTGRPVTNSAKVKLSAVYAPEDANHENHEFWTATPSGQIEMQINNPAAFARFQPGSTCYVTFEFPDAEPAPAVNA